MTLPRGDEYQIAVQNPRISFADPELRACSVERTSLDLPKPYAGAFTTTYHFYKIPQHWAVRCFTREVPDLQLRYQAIGRFLGKQPSPYFVQATCLQQGIRIGNQWHPVIKMEWVDGTPLNLFAQANLSSPGRIRKIRDEFLTLVHQLEIFGIAHGDFQHGNILVKDNLIYLIDYDGIFLPELSRLRSNEIGHNNYQHPSRSESHYNPIIDRFSAIVIYLGLSAAAIKPSLWDQFDDGENILFHHEDFIHPESSPLLEKLATIPQFSNLVNYFRGVCRLEIPQIPKLDLFLSGNFNYPKVEPLKFHRPIRQSPNEWLRTPEKEILEKLYGDPKTSPPSPIKPSSSIPGTPSNPWVPSTTRSSSPGWSTQKKGSIPSRISIYRIKRFFRQVVRGFRVFFHWFTRNVLNPLLRRVTPESYRRIFIFVSCLAGLLIAIYGLLYFSSFFIPEQNASKTLGNQKPSEVYFAEDPSLNSQTSTSERKILQETVGLPSAITVTGCSEADVNVREQPFINSRVIGLLENNQCVEFASRDQSIEWLRIAEDQIVQAGWVRAAKVNLEAPIESLPEAIP